MLLLKNTTVKPQGVVSVEVAKLTNDYKLSYTNCSGEDLYMATKENE